MKTLKGSFMFTEENGKGRHVAHVYFIRPKIYIVLA
jgi:hypothetical protein